MCIHGKDYHNFLFSGSNQNHRGTEENAERESFEKHTLVQQPSSACVTPSGVEGKKLPQGMETGEYLAPLVKII